MRQKTITLVALSAFLCLFLVVSPTQAQTFTKQHVGQWDLHSAYDDSVVSECGVDAAETLDILWAGTCYVGKDYTDIEVLLYLDTLVGWTVASTDETCHVNVLIYTSFEGELWRELHFDSIATANGYMQYIYCAVPDVDSNLVYTPIGPWISVALEEYNATTDEADGLDSNDAYIKFGCQVNTYSRPVTRNSAD